MSPKAKRFWQNVTCVALAPLFMLALVVLLPYLGFAWAIDKTDDWGWFL